MTEEDSQEGADSFPMPTMGLDQVIEPPKEKPAGVKILVILYFVVAVITFFQAIYLMFYGLWDYGLSGFCCATPWLFLAFVYFLIGVGMNMMLKWSWLWALIFAFIGILSGLLNLGSAAYYPAEFDLPAYYYVIPLFQLIVNPIIIWYLMKIKDEFRDIDPEMLAQMQQAQMEGRPAPPPKKDYITELEQLSELRDKGIITEEEFEAKKKELMK